MRQGRDDKIALQASKEGNTHLGNASRGIHSVLRSTRVCLFRSDSPRSLVKTSIVLYSIQSVAIDTQLFHR